MIKAIIFDWSGTLVDDIPPVLEATNAVLTRCGRPKMDRETYRREFCLPYTDFYRRHTPEASNQLVEDTFRHAFINSQEPVSLLPHAKEFLKASKEMGHLHIVLSSSLQECVENQADQFGIRGYFDAIYAGVLDKRLFISEMLAKHGLLPEQTLYVGDMVHDVETAKQAGIPIVGVLTAYDFEPVLRAAQPDLLLEDLSQCMAPLGVWHHTGELPLEA